MTELSSGEIKTTICEMHLCPSWFEQAKKSSFQRIRWYYTEGVFMSSGWSNFNVHIFSIFGRLYHINSEINMHIFSIFRRLYHTNSETDMHIFSCLGNLHNIDSQIFVYVVLDLLENLKYLNSPTVSSDAHWQCKIEPICEHEDNEFYYGRTYCNASSFSRTASPDNFMKELV